MKVRWNACYALGNAFRNSALPLDSAAWSDDAFSALCGVVTSCKNFKVRIKSAAALSVPAQRSAYGGVERFARVWSSLATALENSEDTHDFLEYRYCASLRHSLSQALTHLLSLSQSQDMAGLGASLAGEEGRGIREHLVKYLSEREVRGGGPEGEVDNSDPLQRTRALQDTLDRIRELLVVVNGDQERKGADVVLAFLEDVLKSSEDLRDTPTD